MNNRLNTKSMLEAAYLSAMTVFFAVVGFYLPAFMAFAIFLSTVPLVILVVRTNEKIALLAAFISYFLIIMFTGEIIVATTTWMSFSFSGLALGYGMKRRWNFQKLLITSSGAYLFSLLLIIVLINHLAGVNQIDILVNEYLSTMDRSMEQMNNVMGNVQIPSDKLAVIKDTVTYLVPGFLIISSAVFGFISLFLSKMVVCRIGYDYKYLPVFSELKVSRVTTGVFTISFLLFMFSDQTIFSAAIANIALILSVMLMVCGISVMDYFVKRAGIPGIVRVIIYIIGFSITTVLALIIPVLHPFYVLIVLTLVDSALDLRKLSHKGENHGQ